MLRHVLTCLPIHGPHEACLETSLRFAAGYGSWLTGMVVREPAPLPYPMVGNPMDPGFPSGEVLAEMQREVDRHEAREDEAQRSLLQRFAAACRKHEVPGGTLVRCGSVRDHIAVAAVTADLVCVGRGEREGTPLGSTAGWLARNLSRPVLIAGKMPRPLARIAVAFDGSAAAGRALSLAADIAKRWREKVHIDLVHVRTTDTPGDFLDQAAHYLKVYEIDHQRHEVPGKAATEIVAVAERLQSDLLVMGAYGHYLVRELLLGSTTQEVVSRWAGPLLLWR